MKTRLVPQIKIVLTIAAWGGSFVATKIALQEMSPVTVVWLRFTIGVVILGITVALRRQFRWPNRKELAYFTLLGFIGISFHQWLQSAGLVTSGAATTAWLVSTTPVFIALFGWLGLKERLGWLAWFGILLATLGMVLVVAEGDLSKLASGSFGKPGDLLILFSALNWAVFTVLSRHGAQNYPPGLTTFFTMLIGWLMTSLQFIVTRGYLEVPHISAVGWQSVWFLGIAATGLAYIFWFDALAELSAAQAGAFLYLEPLFTSAFASMVLDERIYSTTLIGGLTILIGVWLVNRPVKSKTIPVKSLNN